MKYFCKSDSFEVLCVEVLRYETVVQEKIEECKSLKSDIEGFISTYNNLEEDENFYHFLEFCLYDRWNEFADIDNVKRILKKEIQGIIRLIDAKKIVIIN